MHNRRLQDSFDFILFAGVLYHVTDPVLALRIMDNCLKNGARCVIETEVIHSPDHILLYEGSGVTRNGCAEDLNKSGWNWFAPSPTTLSQRWSMLGSQTFGSVRLFKSRPGSES